MNRYEVWQNLNLSKNILPATTQMEKCLLLHQVPTECLLEDKTLAKYTTRSDCAITLSLSTSQIRGYILYLYHFNLDTLSINHTLYLDAST